MPTYLDGVSDAAQAVVWLAGALTVVLAIALLVVVLVLLAEPTYRRASAWAVRHRLQRDHARSGRTTGLD